MTEIKLTKRYPNSRTEDITDAYMRGWNDALDAIQNGKFHIADTPQTEQTEPKQGTDCTEVEPTTEDCSMVADNENCMDCVHFEQCTTNGWTDCHYMPIADCPWK